MAVDLTKQVEKVILATTTEAKKTALLEMIETSHAKKTTKTLFTNKLMYVNLTAKQIDKLAYDYMLSGEGMKV